MPQNIFGTDGVRGVANADLSCDLAFRLGRAATKFLGPDICVGRDTRLSGTMLESALTAGIMAEGGRPHCCGVIPTPAVALLTVQNELDGGIVISASHNPPEFNGIKFFSRKGMKLPDAVEEEISAWVMSEEAMAADTLPTGAGVGHIIKMKDARKAYVDHAIEYARWPEARRPGRCRRLRPRCFLPDHARRAAAPGRYGPCHQHRLLRHRH